MTSDQAHRTFAVSERVHRALSVHYLPDHPAIHAAREVFRVALRLEPEGLELEARLEYREAALDAFDAAVELATGRTEESETP